MVSLSEFAQHIPLYKQPGTKDVKIPYMLLGLITSVLIFILKTILNILERQCYSDVSPPEDILEVVREIDSEKKKEGEESLESRVCNSHLKSQLYGKDCSLFKIVKSVFDNTIDLVTVVSGFLPFLYDISKKCASIIHWENNETVVSILCVILQSLFQVIVSIPWNYYDTFVIEEKHGFNKQTRKLFFTDLLKEILIEIVLNIPLYTIIIFVLHKAGPHAYFYCWLAMTVFAVVFNMIYPIVIMPLFNKMSPMEDTPLRARIYEIAENVGFRVGRIQVIDSSTRTGHSNAAAYGLFGVNGILIYDTLMNQLTEDEIVAVICHELGHWKFSHIYRVLLFLQSLHNFVLFKLFSFFVFNADMYASYGFADLPVAIGLSLFLTCIYGVVEVLVSLFMNVFSRKDEYQADEFATRMGYGHHLRVALTKLEVENSMTFKTHWLVELFRHKSCFYYYISCSHPSFVSRCSHIKEIEKRID